MTKIAVINDGQTIYPIHEGDLLALGDGHLSDTMAMLNVMTGEEYGEWSGAQELPCDLDVGTAEMGEHCQRLIDEGALYVCYDAGRMVAERNNQRLA